MPHPENEWGVVRLHSTVAIERLSGTPGMAEGGQTHSTSDDLLLVDDDQVFCEVLSDALIARGYAVQVAHDVEGALQLADRRLPSHVVVDLVMPGRSGLELVQELCARSDETKVIVLTGYASIATAVEAIKLGATHYLTKPVDADEIVAAFGRDKGDPATASRLLPISLRRLEWEHLHKVLQDCNGNISEAARRLNMHRRTFQRKLYKRPS